MTRSRITAAVAAAVVGLAGCTGGQAADKAGGSAEPTTLTMIDLGSNLDAFPAVEYFIDHLADVSGGKLTIDVQGEWTHSAPDAEQQIVRDVGAGKADFARIGTRAFDRLGVTSFQALTAPMLIDSYPLEAAVIKSGIPTAMLDGLKPLDVTGLGVLAGGLRRPVAAVKPLLNPADWRGITFETRASDGESATVEAFGAKATNVIGPALKKALFDHEVGGLATDLLNLKINQPAALTPYWTANVNLWPQTLALIVNSHRLATLTAQQRGWLETAARDAVKHSLTVADQDAALLGELCDDGARFADASPADLAALRAALQPVYHRLEQDPATKSYLDQIGKLKAATPRGAPLAIPERCTGPAPIKPGVNADPAAASALNGTYRYTLTAEDARKFNASRRLPPPSASELSTLPATDTVTLKDGTWTARESSFPDEGHGTYAVDGKTLTWYWPDDGGQGNFTYTVEANGTLHIRAVPGNPDPGGDFIMTDKPWIKIG